MKSKILNTVLYVVFVPVALLEYFILFWFWGGADVFNLILTPAVFAACMITVMYVMKRIKVKKSSVLYVKIFSVLILPVLTIAIVWLSAVLLGINIHVLWKIIILHSLKNSLTDEFEDKMRKISVLYGMPMLSRWGVKLWG